MKKFDINTAVDFVVVGAGAAGGVVAKELSTAGLDVVVLEQGPYLLEGDFAHDELKNWAFWNSPRLGQSMLTNDHERQPNTFRKTNNETAVVKPTIQYGQCVGGGSVHFTANYWRFHEIDFVERSRWGSISGTGFDDWPITYAELEPYYSKAEVDLGVSGLVGANPFEPAHSKPYPLPPLPVKSSGVLLERGAKKLGWHAYPSPMAILSQPYNGRSGCAHCGYCECFGCEWRAKSSTLATVIPMAEDTGRCEIRDGAYVRQISVDQQGRVNGVVYFDGQRQEHMQRAKAIVVCANGAETPRLLLQSTSSQFPNGLANSNGLVGKYLILESGAGATGTFEHPLNEYKSVVVSRVVQDFYDADPKRGFYGGGGMDARFDDHPIAYALSNRPDLPRWGSDFKRAVKEGYTHTLNVFAHLTSLPMETNTVSLDPRIEDAWGQPALRITYRNHPDDLKNMAFFRDRALDLLQAAGAKKQWGWPVEEVTMSVHLMGTCRMGNDPKTSVVNKYHRAHDVPNLFVVDGSSFVTSGRNQPTCTIQALAYRAADNMIQAAKQGEIASSF